MNKLIIIVFVYLCLTLTAQAQISDAHIKKKTSHEVTLFSDGQFKLMADFYVGKKIDNQFTGGVVLLHDCNASRKKNTRLAKLLNHAGLFVLNIDLRGYGASQSGGFSQTEIRRKSKDIKSYNNAFAALNSYWAKDSLKAFKWLRNKVDNSKQIAIVSFGCSASQAVAVAEKMRVNSLVMITPKMDYSAKERYKNLIDTPTYFISALQNVDSYKTAHELFEWSGSRFTKMQIFKGNFIGHSLLRHHHGVTEDISNWLQQNLK
ncbi:MAG: hypothetical protein JKX78_09865 [Alteromonadaceae bacterium]|nr:hypothetical protein [Alteromonadaceae bacterium]